MYDVLPTPPLAAPPRSRPPAATSAAWVATAIGLLGVVVIYLGTRIPNASIMNIGGMIAMAAGFAVSAVGFGSLVSLLTRDVGARFGIVAANAALAACALLALPLSAAEPGVALLSILLVVLPLTLIGLVLSPPVSEWMRVGAEKNKERRRERFERHMRALDNSPPAVKAAVVALLMLTAIFYMAGPNLPNGPVASELHDRVDELRLEYALGEPSMHRESPRKFQVVKARETRRWLVEGDAETVADLVRSNFTSTSLTITSDEGTHIEAEQCRRGFRRPVRICYLIVSIDVQQLPGDVVEVALRATATTHRM